MVKRLTAVPCAICREPVRIEECKTNDIGKPVHEACYVKRLREEAKKRNIATDHSEHNPVLPKRKAS